MSTFVSVNTYTQAVTFVADRLLTSVKEVIRLSGLDPLEFAGDWVLMHRGVRRWLETKDLLAIGLEVFDPRTNALVGRWDFEIVYGFTGDGAFRVDPDVIKYHIRKQGLLPSSCKYRFFTTTNASRPDVDGWATATLRSTDGFVKQSIGTAVDGSGLSSAAGYWRKVTQ